MSHNATETDAFVTPIVVPDNGDAVDAVPVEDAIEALASRTLKHKNDLAFIATAARVAASDGVKHMHRFSTIAALKAYVATDDSEIAWVGQYGTYIFLSFSATAESLPFVVAPTSGGGRWFLTLNDALDTALGVPRLDSGARVPAASVRNGVVELFDSGFQVTDEAPAYTQNISVATYVLIDFATNWPTPITPSVNVGDKVKIEAMIHARFGGAALPAYIQLRAGATALETQKVSDFGLGANEYEAVHFTPPFFTVVSPGPITFSLHGKCPSAGPNLTLATPALIRATVYRP